MKWSLSSFFPVFFYAHISCSASHSLNVFRVSHFPKDFFASFFIIVCVCVLELKAEVHAGSGLLVFQVRSPVNSYDLSLSFSLHEMLKRCACVQLCCCLRVSASFLLLC